MKNSNFGIVTLRRISAKNLTSSTGFTKAHITHSNKSINNRSCSKILGFAPFLNSIDRNSWSFHNRCARFRRMYSHCNEMKTAQPTIHENNVQNYSNIISSQIENDQFRLGCKMCELQHHKDGKNFFGFLFS